MTGCGEPLGVSSWPGQRVLASVAPRRAHAVRSSVSPAVQRAAVTALGGQLGGVVAMQPSTGQILAVAGIGLDSVQPPGSTFKMVTLTGVLQARLATPHTVYPVCDVRHARRRQAEQRERRGMRRHARTGLRGVLQLRVRPARGQARRGAPGGHRRTLRLQPATRDPGRLREHAAGGLADPGRTRRRIDGHRPGSGAGQRSADGHRGGDDRRSPGAGRPRPSRPTLRRRPARPRSAPRSHAPCAT